MAELNNLILNHLTALYGEEAGRATFASLQSLLARYRPYLSRPETRKLSQQDVILITYGDMVRREGEAPLRTLADFLSRTVAGAISAVHILPFYPYSSDDGFSVIDYKKVRPELGDWEDVSRVGANFRLMFDAVANHISAHSAWFQGFLQDDPQYRDYFIAVEAETDLSVVFRPRALPLLTPVETAGGRKLVWTTFSADQIDLNFANPAVLLEILDVLLFYVAQGAALIRLDAIAFLWKEIGTACIHLEQTHRIIQLFRAVLDEVAPQVALITETNVPHQENISYFGDGTNEAQMVYNFSLPPLVLHAFQTGNAGTLAQWADKLELPSDRVTFFNFLASHDGIGVTPARGILSQGQIEGMAQRVEALGGYVSYHSMPDGSQAAYELNVNYLEALGNPAAGAEDVALMARRFLAAQAIMLSLRGVPGIYFHSLLGSRNWGEGVAQTGRYRAINREKLWQEELERELADGQSLRHKVFYPYLALLKQRAARPAFDPYGEQQILFVDEAVFGVARRSRDGKDAVICLHNVAAEAREVRLGAGGWELGAGRLRDVVSGKGYAGRPGQDLRVRLEPYQVAWLAAGGR